MAECKQRKSMLEKLEDAAPYNIFYNEIPSLPEASKQSNFINFQDLLCPSLGKLHSSLQIGSKIDIFWLMKQYEEKDLSNKPLTILYGEEKPEVEEHVDKYLPNVTIYCVAMNGADRFGSHHSKIGIYLYEDRSLRVVVSTANLYQQQWDQYIHGFWVSPPCRRLPTKSGGESPTYFKAALIAYLEHYQLPSILDPWIEHVQHADFSDVKVFLLTSVPGSHSPTKRASHLQQVRHLVERHCSIPNDEDPWPIIAQASSLGSFGESSQTWLCGEFLRSLGGNSAVGDSPTSAALKIVFPSERNVASSQFGTKSVEDGDGLRYERSIHAGQKWVERYLQGGWGREDTRRNRGHTYTRNYETGIMFFPKFFGEKFFNVKPAFEEAVDEKVFPLIYDLPLEKYEAKDKPWTVAKLKGFSRKTIYGGNFSTYYSRH